MTEQPLGNQLLSSDNDILVLDQTEPNRPGREKPSRRTFG